MIKRALILSVVTHTILLSILLLGFGFKAKPREVAISARLVMKGKVKNKDLLPKKAKEKPAKEALKEKPKELLEKNSQDLAKSLALKPKVQEKNPLKKTENYTETLAALSKSFTEEMKSISQDEPEDEGGEDYFDQMYSLLKTSFVIPPHLNGPKGEKLQAVLRIYLAKDGSIKKLDLETPSGDDHFDKAVMDGARRVNNFGPVPIFLQDTMRERGLIVDLCPFKCLNSR